MSAEGDLLDAWEATHGRLDPKWIELFLEDPALDRLVRAPRNCALHALRVHNKLQEAATLAEQLAQAEAEQTRRTRKVPGTPVQSIDDVLALYEDYVLQQPMPADFRDAWQRHAALPRMIGFKRSRLVEAALRLDPPITPSRWLAELHEAERRSSVLSAGSVLDGRSDKHDHRPSRPGGVYKKGDI
jgi:hypothetical protein